MLNKIFITLFVTAISFVSVYANPSACQDSECSNPSCTTVGMGFNYIKLGGGFLPNGSDYTAGPSMGLGRRFQFGSKAVDISFNWTAASRNYYLSLPKIMHLHYFTPNSDASIYVGGGLSYGITRNRGKRKNFNGIAGELAVGYEFHRCSPLRTFAELNLSQGLLPLSSNHQISAPTFSFALGVGF